MGLMLLRYALVALLLPILFLPHEAGAFYFPPSGESIANQSQKTAPQVDLDGDIVANLNAVITTGRWALWRHGYLVHVEDDFNQTSEIKSLRKLFHAVTAGVAAYRGLIPSLSQPISVWNPELTGLDASATWRHVLTQTSAFDEPVLAPGSLWAYSDANPFQLNRALARVWGRTDYTDNYDLVISDALLDPIDAQGWSTYVAPDGIRLIVDLEDLGRMGLLLVAGGQWDGTRLVAQSFVDDLSAKQTYEIPPNYNNANDGQTGLRVSDFPESPYGYMAWVNTDQDLYPAAAATWALGHGSGGHYVAYDPASGVVLAMLDADFVSVPGNPPGWPTPVRAALEVVQADITGPNPLAPGTTPPSAPTSPSASAVGQSVQLTWGAASDPEGIATYRIYRGLSPAGAKSQIAEEPGLELLDTTTAPGTAYDYEISAVNGAGLEGPVSPEVSATTGDSAPAAPAGLVSIGGDGQADLDWEDNAEPDVVGYRVHRSTSPGGPYTDVSGLIWASDYVDGGLLNGTTYYHVVTAEDAIGQESPNSIEVATTPTSLVAHWRMNEGSGSLVGDAVGSNDGMTMGTSWTAGTTGFALEFDGVASYVAVPDSVDLDYSSVTGATVSLWARPDRLGASDEQTLYGHWSDASSARTLQLLLTTNDTWQCLTNSGDGSATSVATASLGSWTHLACVWSPAGLVIYVDGVVSGSDTNVLGSLSDNSGLHSLGVRDKSGSREQHLEGLLDEVQIYGRALAAAEIAALAEGGSNTVPALPPLGLGVLWALLLGGAAAGGVGRSRPQHGGGPRQARTRKP
jgi:hypothetical protein